MSDDKNRSEVLPANDAAEEALVAPAPLRGRRWLRGSLLALGPLLVLGIGAFIYMTSGRYAATDDAYVKSDTVLITAEVAGPIRRVAVRENERVHSGDVLFEIDDARYQLMIQRGESQVAAVESFIESLDASYRQQLEQLELAKINVAYYDRELERQQELVATNLGTDADIASARHNFEVATQQIPIIEQSLAQLRAQIGGKFPLELDGVAPLRSSPFFDSNAAYRTVSMMLEDAKLDLARTVVYAPFDGVVSRVPTVGRYIAPGSPVMSLVADHDVWVEANFKETELAHVEPGQKVAVRIDTYPDHQWRGTVESISPATGAEFSVIPAQNASGNWVKVAQRIPVRISIDVRPGDPQLRAGMSAVVEIDTGFQRQAPSFLSFLGILSVSSITETATARDRS